jgi:hypothetical protein
MCARVGIQRSCGVVTARVQTDAIQSLHNQHRDLHQSTYPIPLRRSGLILLSRDVVEVVVDISYVAPQAHGIANVALHRAYSLGIIFIFSQWRKDLYHV